MQHERGDWWQARTLGLFRELLLQRGQLQARVLEGALRAAQLAVRVRRAIRARPKLHRALAQVSLQLLRRGRQGSEPRVGVVTHSRTPKAAAALSAAWLPRTWFTSAMAGSMRASACLRRSSAVAARVLAAQ